MLVQTNVHTPRDLNLPSRLHCLVGDFAHEDLFNLVDGLLIHGI
jgi:hypothetical protein